MSDCQQDRDDTTVCTVTVIRTSNAQRVEFALCLDTTTLLDLKQRIRASSLLLPHDAPTTTTLRLLYMGRELKTNGRSLRSLGVGKSISDGGEGSRYIHVVVARGGVSSSPAEAAAVTQKSASTATSASATVPSPSASVPVATTSSHHQRFPRPTVCDLTTIDDNEEEEATNGRKRVIELLSSDGDISDDEHPPDVVRQRVA